MSKNNVITFRLNDEEFQALTSLVFISGLNQTDYIKSKIFPGQEIEEEKHEIKELLFKIHEQNDMIQKILLSSSHTENTVNIKHIRELQKQEYVTYALTTKIALDANKYNQEIVYTIIDKAKDKANKIFGED